MQKTEYLSPDWNSLQTSHGDHLPHWQCERAVYHVSFRLADSVPESRKYAWLVERQNILDNIAYLNRDPTDQERERLQHLYSEKIEKYLDAGHGECLLARPKAGRIVADALEFFIGQRYYLHVYCVMPNHVHVLLEPVHDHDLRQIVHSWTSYTATRINQALGRNGQLWQHDPYDHIVRSEKEYLFQLDYIWRNPGNMKTGYIRKRFDQS
ncbi:MAG: transposase [Lentisphaeria bacterium]